MIVTFKRGRILIKFIVAWILLSVDAVDSVDVVAAVAAVDADDVVGAPHVQRDFASVEDPSSKIVFKLIKSSEDVWPGYRLARVAEVERNLQEVKRVITSGWAIVELEDGEISGKSYGWEIRKTKRDKYGHKLITLATVTTDATEATDTTDATENTTDVGFLSTESPQILPVEGNFGSLKHAINRCIFRKECDIVNFGKLLSIFEERDAKQQEEVSELKQQLKSSKQSKARLEDEVTRLKIQLKNVSSEQKSMKEEITKLREELESALYRENMKKTFKLVGEYNENNRYSGCDGCKNWDDAREDCKRRGGELATHLSKPDLDFIFSKVITTNFVKQDRFRSWAGVWVGGRMYDGASQGNFKQSFRWVAGRNKRISHDDGLWVTGAPIALDMKCMSILRNISPQKTKSGTKGPAYSTYRCDYNKPYLCEFAKNA